VKRRLPLTSSSTSGQSRRTSVDGHSRRLGLLASVPRLRRLRGLRRTDGVISCAGGRWGVRSQAGVLGDGTLRLGGRSRIRCIGHADAPLDDDRAAR
jgi:hypothetical protein